MSESAEQHKWPYKGTGDESEGSSKVRKGPSEPFHFFKRRHWGPNGPALANRALSSRIAPDTDRPISLLSKGATKRGKAAPSAFHLAAPERR